MATTLEELFVSEFENLKIENCDLREELAEMRDELDDLKGDKTVVLDLHNPMSALYYAVDMYPSDSSEFGQMSIEELTAAMDFPDEELIGWGKKVSTGAYCHLVHQYDMNFKTTVRVYDILGNPMIFGYDIQSEMFYKVETSIDEDTCDFRKYFDSSLKDELVAKNSQFIRSVINRRIKTLREKESEEVESYE